MRTESISVLHAAETVRGGVASVLKGHLVFQASHRGIKRVSVLAPENQMSDIIAPGAAVSYHSFGRSTRNAWSLMRFAWAFMLAVWRDQPDVVHLHSSFAGMLGRLILVAVWPVRRPVVYYCPHGFVFLAPDRNTRLVKLLTAAELVMAHFTDAIICVSQYEYEAARSHGFPHARLRLIPNGVATHINPIQCTHAPIQYEHARRHTPHNTFSSPLRLLFVGRLDYAKGFDLLYSAFATLDPDKFELIVIGESVLNDLKALPALPNMTYLGWLPQERLADYYSNADVLVVPSRWEAFGLVVVEAATYGCPTLSSNTPGLVQLVTDGITGKIFDPQVPRSLETILTSTSTLEWTKMGRLAQKTLTAQYSLTRMCEATLALYLEPRGHSLPLRADAPKDK